MIAGPIEEHFLATFGEGANPYELLSENELESYLAEQKANEEPDPDPEPTFDADAAAARILAAAPGSAAADKAWAAISPEEADALAARGLTRPQTIDDEGFRPSPHYSQARADAELRAGMSDITSGRLAVTSETFGRISELASIADSLPASDDRQRDALERATHLIGKARAQAFEQAPFVTTKTTTRRIAAGWEVEETDPLGRSRIAKVLSLEEAEAEIEAARAEAEALEKDTSVKLTLEDLRGATTEELVRLRARDPETWERLKQAESDSREAWATRGGLA